MGPTLWASMLAGEGQCCDCACGKVRAVVRLPLRASMLVDDREEAWERAAAWPCGYVYTKGHPHAVCCV